MILRQVTSLFVISVLSLLTLSATPHGWQAGVRPDEQDPFFSKRSNLVVGAKGEEVLDVSVPAVCGEQTWVFDHADLQINRKRFGEARFVELPESGCTECRPLKVRWYHEPTGYLEFSVRVWRKSQKAPCKAPFEQ